MTSAWLGVENAHSGFVTERLCLYLPAGPSST